MADAIRIAMIGAGKIARDQHLPALATDDRLILAATADRHGGLGRALPLSISMRCPSMG